MLSNILTTTDYGRITIMGILFYPQKKWDAEKNLANQIQKNDKYYQEYQTLIGDDDEQQLFDKMSDVRKRNVRYREQIFNLLRTGNQTAALNTDKDSLAASFEELHITGARLSDFISQRDGEKIKNIENQLKDIDELNVKTNIGIIIILTLLGIVIFNTLRTMRSKNMQLMESERKYRRLTEQTNEIIEKFDASGKLIFANNSFKRKLGYTEEELSTLTIFDILGDKSGNLNKPNPDGKEIITDVKKVFKAKNGRDIFIEGTVFLEYQDNKFIGSTGFFNDVTEKKHLEKSILSSEEKFRQLFNLAPIPMWLFDPETNLFLQVNNAAVKHYGYSEKEFLNKSIMDIRPKEDVSKFIQYLDKIKDKRLQLSGEGKVFRGNYTHVKKNGEWMNVEIYNTPIEINNSIKILTVAIDVSERVQLENKITKAIIKTQEDERYEIGSELHDNVCQILASAKMSLGMLKSNLPASVTGLYNQSQDSIKLATDEVRNLSHRLAPAFFDNTTLEETFDSLLKTFNLEQKYDISLYFDKTLNFLNISREMQLNLYRILQEQLRNTMKYAKGTTIEVDVLVHKNFLKMRIADNGVGFDVKEVKSGIGLANMKRRAELFGGNILINSSPGNGCELIVTLPLSEMN